MNAEYQRLEAEASEVQNQIDELVSSCSQMVATEFPKFEARIAGLHQRLAGSTAQRAAARNGAAETGSVRENAGIKNCVNTLRKVTAGCRRVSSDSDDAGTTRPALVTDSAICGLAIDGFPYSGPVKELEVWRLEIAATRHHVKAWGIAPGNRTISNRKALKGRDWKMRRHFAPLGLFMSRSIYPRAMPWAFTFWAFGPDLSLQ